MKPDRFEAILTPYGTKCCNSIYRIIAAQESQVVLARQNGAGKHQADLVAEEESVLLARHAALIDKKFLEGLSVGELQELEQIRARMEEFDAPFYEPIIERLTAMFERQAAPHNLSQPQGN